MRAIGKPVGTATQDQMNGSHGSKMAELAQIYALRQRS
jgi:hypothetical protein